MQLMTSYKELLQIIMIIVEIKYTQSFLSRNNLIKGKGVVEGIITESSKTE